MVELVVVLVIVAVLAATAAPAMNSITSGRARLATDRLLRDLTFAQQRAMATGATSWVTFDTASDSWGVLAEDPSNPGRTGATGIVDPATGRPYAVTMGTGSDDYPDVDLLSVNIDSGFEVGFDWLGRPLNAGETALSNIGIITISDGNSILIWPETGHCWIP